MSLTISIDYVAWREMLSTLLPDFVLAFAFFTALCYGVLGPRFQLQRPAIVISTSLGIALSTGLVWWEHVNALSTKNLGPVAVGFALVILAGVMYQAVRQVGGGWAGAGLALGISLLVGWCLGLSWPVSREIVQTIIGVALTVGILAFLIHSEGRLGHSHRTSLDIPSVRHDMRDLHRARRVGRRLKGGLRRAKREAKIIARHPEAAGDVTHELQRMLPAEGWLTKRLAELRKQAYRVRKGHVARIGELREVYPRLSPPAKRKVARELGARYKELKIDVRLERLDKAVAEKERRIRDLTRQAQQCLQAGDSKKAVDVLTQATKLQTHNTKLFKIIDSTKERLIKTARKIARESSRGHEE